LRTATKEDIIKSQAEMKEDISRLQAATKDDLFRLQALSKEGTAKMELNINQLGGGWNKVLKTS
jgi:uncharacterized protein YajQ (UPF0234 family)